MEKFINYDRTTTTIKPETLTVKTNDLSHLMDIIKTGGESMARAIGNTYPGNFGVGTDNHCMVGKISSKPTKNE